MTDAFTPSLSSLIQGFIFSITAEGKAPATVHYYQGNLRIFFGTQARMSGPKVHA
jgi:hypothetical protein